MDAHGYASCVPRAPIRRWPSEPLLDFTSGYVQRSIDQFPKQGSRAPWRLRQNYALDLRAIRRGPVDDGTMRFCSRASEGKPAQKLAA